MQLLIWFRLTQVCQSMKYLYWTGIFGLFEIIGRATMIREWIRAVLDRPELTGLSTASLLNFA